MLPSFQNPQLLITALTHRSALNEQVSSATESNERLEYLGDAVLELATSRFLFDRFPQEPEGNLTAYRSGLVKTTTLAELALEIGLGEKILMSKGEESGGGRTNPNLLADTFEAVVGALYLDQSLEAATAFLAQTLFPKFDKMYQEKLFRDPKSRLQEVVQAAGFTTPEYRVVSETGPDHDKQFTVQVLIDGQPTGQGSGKSKQMAQQAAAEAALEQWQI